jgi:CRISPR-associated endonuclease Csn1
MKNELIFGFDVGKASLGICVRKNDEILNVQSLLIPAEYADTSYLTGRRRAFRTRLAHKAREAYLNKIWQEAGLNILSSNDTCLKKEFPSKNEEIVYNSALLRILLLQDKQLEEWQIYKALHSAIQKRGYDNEVAWANTSSKKEEEAKYMTEYKKEMESLIQNSLYHYPCYRDALLLGLWHEKEPNKIQKRINNNANKIRKGGMVAPRELVEKECMKLLENAKKQLPSLNIDASEFLYGEAKQPYASFLVNEYKKFRGTIWDWQGVLSQKIPRFDNRVIAKCRLMPNRNVCNVSSKEHVYATIALQLKNLRIIDIYGEKKALSSEEINLIFEKKKEDIDKNIINKKKIDFSINKLLETIAKMHPNEKIENISVKYGGRSSFCRPALNILFDLIMSGKSPKEFDINKYITTNTDDISKGITKNEIISMMNKLGDTWENIHISDNRDTLLETAKQNKEKAISNILKDITNPVVRHRLQFFYNKLKELEKEYGQPTKVVFEFIRDGSDNSLEGKKKVAEISKNQNENKKYNKLILDKLCEQFGSVANIPKSALMRLKLFEQQKGLCLYTGEQLCVSKLMDYEIDHIYHISRSGCDAFFNKVLCLAKANQEKQNRTPKEWLMGTDKWDSFVSRVNDLKIILGKKKHKLLLASASEAEEIIERYNGLAETAYVARLAQLITSANFSWGLQTQGDNRKIFVSNGRNTAKIRAIYNLNELLYSKETDIEKIKNRSNPKHHALDAICITYSQTLKTIQEDTGRIKSFVEGLNRETIVKKIEELIPVQVKRNVDKLRLDESIYGKYKLGDNEYVMTKRKNIAEIEQKKSAIEKIIDEDIKQDLFSKYENLEKKEWVNMLENYIHLKRKTKVLKVKYMASSPNKIIIQKNGRERFNKFLDMGNKDTKGQFKLSKEARGQFIYFDAKNVPRVKPVYANQKISEVKDELQKNNYKLYKDGILFNSGCLLNIPNDFYSGKNIEKSGIYKLRSIKSNSVIMIESNNGQEILTSVKNLVQADFEKYSI